MDFLDAAPFVKEMDVFHYAIGYDDYKLFYVSLKTRQAFPQAVPGALCHEVFAGSSTPCGNCLMQSVHKGRNTAGKTIWNSKQEKWIHVEYTDVETAEGLHVCMATGVDITAVQEGAHNTEHVLDSIRAAAYTIGVDDHRIRSINQELRNMLPEIRVGDICHEAIWGSASCCYFCPIAAGVNKDAPSHIEVYNKKLKRHLSIDVARVTSANGEKIAVFTGYDITRLVESEKRLTRAAYADMQTGVGNRFAFMEELSGLYERGEAGCLCVLNIKYLKRYNLLFGRKKGDRLLKQIAKLFASLYLKTKVYRVDGAKFGFLAVGESEVRLLREVVREARRDFVANWDNPGFHLYLDAAFLVFPDFAERPEQAIHNAEYLLRKYSKAESSNTLEFDRNEQDLLDRRNGIEEIIRVGPQCGEFDVFYQPIFDIQSGGYTKCEALLRLHDEKLGWVPPIEFIPIAEATGHIAELGAFVLNEVCAFLADRIARGLPPLRVNVNISALEVVRQDFFEGVVSAVRRWNVPASQIQLELTESSLTTSTESMIEVMNRLIAEGFTFAIDDFGTGYSSLSYIGQMPVECLKLDKSFMDMLLESEAYRLIVTNVIGIAKGLKLSIVAEGIESEPQYELIKALGGNYIQGFLFSRPLPRKEFEAFLEEHGQPAQNGSSQ